MYGFFLLFFLGKISELSLLTLCLEYLYGNYSDDLFVTLGPCLMCLGAILHARIRNVYFAASDIKTGACGGLIDLTINNSLNHHCNFHKGILSKESTDLIQNFFQGKRAKKNRT